MTDLSPYEKRSIILTILHSEYLREYCKSLGLNRDDISLEWTTVIGAQVVDCLIEGLEDGLAKGVKKIMDQRLESSETIDRWLCQAQARRKGGGSKRKSIRRKRWLITK